MTKRRAQAGFTVTELMVSSAIGLFTLAVAVRVAADHTAILSQTTSRLDTLQSARMSIDLMAEDIRHAGLGIGYRPDGRFAGIIRGTFTVSGGAQFGAQGFNQTLTTGAIPTDDLGLRIASGDLRTIAQYFGTQGQICAGGDFTVGDTVMLLTREGLHGQTVRLNSLNGGSCTEGRCRDGCTTFTYSVDSSYQSDAGAALANFVGGTMVGDYSEVVWFVVPGASGSGELRRAEINEQNPCAARDSTCGGRVAEDVETLQVGVWQWDDDLAQWVDRTQAASVDDRRRVRVDVEVVLRGRQDGEQGAHHPIALELDPNTCVGGACGGSADTYRRSVVRTSVEIRNGGRMLLR